MDNEAAYKGREEVERLPAVDSDLENGTSDVNNRNDSGESVQAVHLGEFNVANWVCSERQPAFLHHEQRSRKARRCRDSRLGWAQRSREPVSSMPNSYREDADTA